MREKLNKKCPVCKKKGMVKWCEADGPDDYKTVVGCMGCGERWES